MDTEIRIYQRGVRVFIDQDDNNLSAKYRVIFDYQQRQASIRKWGGFNGRLGAYESFPMPAWWNPAAKRVVRPRNILR